MINFRFDLAKEAVFGISALSNKPW